MGPGAHWSGVLADSVWQRYGGRITGNSGRFSFGNVANFNGWTDATFLIRFKPTALTDGRCLLSKTQSAALDGLMVRLDGTAGNIRVDRDFATTDALYITNDVPLIAGVWSNIVVVFRASGQSISIYSAPFRQPCVERTYGTATDGTGAIGTADSSNNLVLGNRTTATTVAAEGSYSVFAAIRAAGGLSTALTLAQEPRVYAGLPGCLVFGVFGSPTLASANTAFSNIARYGTINQLQIIRSAGGLNAPCAGPCSVVGARRLLNRRPVLLDDSAPPDPPELAILFPKTTYLPGV